ncbi:MAG: dihydroorotate dehydrogenase electron transfer subunit [Dehalococcoidia bacterium]
MRLEQALVVSHEQVCPDTFLMWLSCPALARGAAPGRFLMIRCADGYDPLLPRPMSFHRFREEAGERQFAILYDVRGRGTSWLSSRKVGDQLSVFGPLGKGYTVSPRAQNLLLVGGGLGVAALIALADEAVAGGKAVTLVQGARTAAKLYPPDLLPPEVEVLSATDDGSAGHKGYVTDLLPEHLSWADQLFTCGPTAMLAAMTGVLRKAGCRKPAQALLEEHLGCGTGICYGCAVFTRKGVRLVCKDGPRFDLREVFS